MTGIIKLIPITQNPANVYCSIRISHLINNHTSESIRVTVKIASIFSHCFLARDARSEKSVYAIARCLSVHDPSVRDVEVYRDSEGWVTSKVIT